MLKYILFLVGLLAIMGCESNVRIVSETPSTQVVTEVYRDTALGVTCYQVTLRGRGAGPERGFDLSCVAYRRTP